MLSSEFIFELDGRPTPQCHASTIVETEGGLAAAWFGGTREKNPDVAIYFSRHEGDGWSEPTQVVDGSEETGEQTACWNPVLFRPADGPLMLFYKVGLSPSSWHGMLTTSEDGGQTWSTPRRLGRDAGLGEGNDNLIGPVKNKPVLLSDGTILAPSSSEHDGWRVHFELSEDGGKTWELVGPLDGGVEAIQPSVLKHGDRRLQIMARTRTAKTVATSWSSDNGRTWTDPAPTSLPNPNSGTDAVTLADGRHLLVYNPTVRGLASNGRETLAVATSEDGEEWERVLTLEDGRPGDEFSYPAVIQTADGRVHITYTWQRRSVKHVVLDPSLLGASSATGR